MKTLNTNQLGGSSMRGINADPFQSLFDRIGAALLWGTLQSVSDQTKIAKAEIKRFSERHPKDSRRYAKVFVQLRWMHDTILPAAVYQEHVSELLRRVTFREPLDLGTKSEVLMLLSEGSLVAPLGPRCAALYAQLFEACYPAVFDDRLTIIHEPWKNSSKRLLDQLRQELSVDRLAPRYWTKTS